jgi:hypothetical protein
MPPAPPDEELAEVADEELLASSPPLPPVPPVMVVSFPSAHAPAAVSDDMRHPVAINERRRIRIEEAPCSIGAATITRIAWR